MITEIRVGCARTINLGNFESLRIEAAATMQVPEGEDLSIAKANLQSEPRTLMEDTYRAQHKPTKKEQAA